MTIHENLASSGLVRPINDRVIGGVCAGIGRKIGLDPWPTRFLFILAMMILPGSQFLVYPLLWILMPSEHQWVPTQAYGGQPFAGQPYPGQPYPAQAYPAQQPYQAAPSQAQQAQAQPSTVQDTPDQP